MIRIITLLENMKTNLASPDKGTIRSLFNSIAEHYDFINTLLSLKLDSYWRRKSRKILIEGQDIKSILDLGVGTGKFISLFAKQSGVNRLVGLDFSEEMLKLAKKELPKNVSVLSGDFHALPFENGSFDLIISSFTLRSVKDMRTFMLQIYDALGSYGQVGLLCLTRPTNPIIKALFIPYLKFYLPFVGKIISGKDDAYQFLSQSVQHFQEPNTTVDLLRRSGFQTIRVKRLTFGIATLIVARK